MANEARGETTILDMESTVWNTVKDSGCTVVSQSGKTYKLPLNQIPIPTKTSDITNDSGYVADAPVDGKQYARKNGVWEEVKGGGSSGEWINIPVTKKGEFDGGYVKVFINTTLKLINVVGTLHLSEAKHSAEYMEIGDLDYSSYCNFSAEFSGFSPTGHNSQFRITNSNLCYRYADSSENWYMMNLTAVINPL